eukprot:Em0004g1439a
MSNLPREYEEKNIEYLLRPYGSVISTRVLRDQSGVSRGVGFARLDAKDNCERAIEALNGSVLDGATEALVIKFADGGSGRKKGNPQGRWSRDLAELAYEGPSLFNGLVASRGLVHQGMVTQYGVAHTPISGYQIPASTSGTWPGQTFYIPTPAAGPGMDGIHALTGQLGAVHLTSPYGNPMPHPQYHLQAAHHSAQYSPHAPGGWAQTPGGWTMTQAPAHIVQSVQVGMQEHGEGGGGDSKTHHIQVITSDHLGQVEDKTGTVYYPPPSTSWSGK